MAPAFTKRLWGLSRSEYIEINTKLKATLDLAMASGNGVKEHKLINQQVNTFIQLCLNPTIS